MQLRHRIDVGSQDTLMVTRFYVMVIDSYLCNRKGGGDLGKWLLNVMLFFTRREETKQTVLQNRTPG